MDPLHHFTWIILAPALVAGVFALPALLPGTPGVWAARLLLPVGLGLGYVAGFVGFHGRLFLPPRLSFHWLPVIALAASAFAVLIAWAGSRRWLVPASLSVLGLLMVAGLVPGRLANPGAVAAVLVLPLLQGGIMLWAPRHPSAMKLGLWAWVIFSFSGVALLLGATARLAQLSGLVPCAVLPVMLMLFRRRDLVPAEPLIPFLVSLHGASLLIGWMHASLPAAAMALLMASPAALAVERIPFIARRGRVVRACALAGALVLMGGGAVAVCLAGADFPTG